MSYTYDDLCRVCKRRTADLNTGIITDESFTLDAAGNILDDHNFEYYYSANNQLQECTEYCLEYDEDGNMTYSFVNYEDTYYTFDSRNRLVSDGTHTYTYNAENTRIRSTCDGVTTYYTYNTNAKLSQLLHKQTQGVVTKYVYGLGLIGEEKQGEFKTYHFDYRGSTVAIIDGYGAITDTFRYDTYGKLISRTGETDTPFLFNGRDGVMTEENGLYYMRARYYSPDLRRFINADIVAGEISNSPTLNRYAFANGNPVSFVDPLGLSADVKDHPVAEELPPYKRPTLWEFLCDFFDNDSHSEPITWFEEFNGKGTASVGNSDFVIANGRKNLIGKEKNLEGYLGALFNLGLLNINGEFELFSNDDISIALNTDLDLLEAGANVGFYYDDGFGLGGGAGASFVSSQAVLSITYGNRTIDVGFCLDLFSIGANLGIGVTKESGSRCFGVNKKFSSGVIGGGVIFSIS